MDLVDPYFRSPSSPVSDPEQPDAQTAATLIKTARWHACLSQADVAQRAQTSQPAVARYEQGKRTPSLDMLRRLLAACGMRLDLTLTPEPGLIDEPTRELLALPPWERLPEPLRRVVEDLASLLRELGVPALLADRAAARLRGALIATSDVEFWVDEGDVDIPALETALEQHGAVLWPCHTRPSFGTGRASRLDRLDGGLHGHDFRIRGVRNFADHIGRAVGVQVPLGSLLITSLDDTMLFWPPRDRGRLALQRAEGLRRELSGPAPL